MLEEVRFGNSISQLGDINGAAPVKCAVNGSPERHAKQRQFICAQNGAMIFIVWHKGKICYMKSLKNLRG